MPTVQPFPMRSEVSHLGGDLQISVPPKRSWVILFYLVWISFWTFAGVQAWRSLIQHFTFFMCLWLMGWVLGELWAAYAILYMVGGREIIQANAETLTCRTQLFGLGWSKTYLVREMRDLRFQPAMSAGRNRRPSRIAFDYGAKTVGFAKEVDEPEAAELIKRIRQRSGVLQSPAAQDSGIKFWQQR